MAAYDEKFCDSPMKPIASLPAGNKGGPGQYNGVDGYPKRTSSPNAVPEKVCDGEIPETQMPSGAITTPNTPLTKTGTKQP